MDIKKLITDLQVCADDDILCPACDRYYEMKEKGGTADCVSQLLRDAAATLEKMPQWIPVAERLPQEYISVLACIPSERPLPMVKEAYMANGNWATKTWIFAAKDVTHWMPLPEPPKEVGND